MNYKEIYSKVLMPKFFDKFAKQFDLTKRQDEQGLGGALEEVYMMYMNGGSQFVIPDEDWKAKK